MRGRAIFINKCKHYQDNSGLVVVVPSRNRHRTTFTIAELASTVAVQVFTITVQPPSSMSSLCRKSPFSFVLKLHACLHCRPSTAATPPSTVAGTILHRNQGMCFGPFSFQYPVYPNPNGMCLSFSSGALMLIIFTYCHKFRFRPFSHFDCLASISSFLLAFRSKSSIFS